MGNGHVWLVLLLSASVQCMRLHPSSRNETYRELAPEDEELLVQILSVQATKLEYYVQSARKLLQKVREWHGTHPAESVFAKCLLHYWIEDKLPEIAATADDDIYEHGRRGLSNPVSLEQNTPEGESQPLSNFQDYSAVQGVSNRILGNGDSAGEAIRTLTSIRSLNDEGNFKFKRKAVKALYWLYMELKDLLSEFKLVGCSVHYLLAKFWEWVDNAP